MAKPTGSLLQNLGPETEAFGRARIKNSSFNGSIKKGEAKSFDAHIINLTNDFFESPKTVSSDNLTPDCRYLWIINHDGLFILLEFTPNPDAARGVVCHTNITKGAKALQGGELWFISSRHVVINYKSGRYGAETDIQQEAVVDYFKSLGYRVDIQG